MSPSESITLFLSQVETESKKILKPATEFRSRILKQTNLEYLFPKVLFESLRLIKLIIPLNSSDRTA